MLQLYRQYLNLMLLALLLLSVSRFVFAILYPETLPSAGSAFIIFLAGLHFDLTATAWLFLPITLFYVYPSGFNYNKNTQRIIRFLYVLILSIALLTNYMDTGWFEFQRKRSTADVFKVITTGNDLVNNLPSYLKDYWYLFLCLIISVLILFRASKKILFTHRSPLYFPSLSKRIAASVFFLGISFIIIRGGTQLKPLSTQSAATYYGPDAAPLILNTPYSLIKSIGDVSLKEPGWLSTEECNALYPVHHRMMNADSIPSKNICLIILESFSSEYTGKKYTPFLDSLSKQSIFFNRAYANAKRSIEGLPAILASMPALMNEPFITSQYNTVRLNSIASLLKKEGYSTSFFHGGKNGTMGFDNFTAAAGFSSYYGASEYNGPSTNNDGNWGIYDHAFYKFMIEKLDQTKQPFVTAVFSLSSHHPYKIPDELQNRYPEGKLPILKSVAYADDALRSFFKEASMQNWYKNTVFIITADHTGPTYTETGSTSTGIFHIPLLIYYDGVKAEFRADIAQQIDILPTTLHYAGYNGTYSSMGRNLANSKNGFAINYNSGQWQLISNTNVISWDGENNPLCNQGADSLSKCKTEFDLLRAGIQQFRSGLIHNTFTAE